MAAMESQGRDIKLDEKRVEGYRNFATKLWNAARFLQMNGVGASDSIAAPAAELPVNRWMIGEVVETLAKLNRAFDELRYDEMADAIYHFVWGTFCDWYLEFVKPLFQRGTDEESGEDREFATETKSVAAWAFDQILVMLHPLMPFITEELWHAMGDRPYDLIVARWPDPDVSSTYEAERGAANFAIELIEKIRSARIEVNVPASAKPTMFVTEFDHDLQDELYWFWLAIQRLARIGISIVTDVKPFPGQTKIESVDREIERAHAKKGIQITMPGMLAILELEGVIDLQAEKSRLAKAAEAAEKERDSLAQRLGNPNFTERAKPEAVEKARADHEAKAAEADRLRAALERLG
jgi:valyl-tRNA synthetase